jgi:hypothetical protein
MSSPTGTRRGPTVASSRRSVQIAWLRLLLAYLLGGILIFALAKLDWNPSRYPEGIAVAQFVALLLAVVLGIPTLLLAAFATRAAAATAVRSTVNGLAALLVLGIAVVLVGGWLIAAQRSRLAEAVIENTPNTPEYGRWGVIVVEWHEHLYRSPADSGPQVARSVSWLQAQHRWPLVQVGIIRPLIRDVPTGDLPRATADFYRHAHAVLRPSGQPDPQVLYLQDRSAYLEYDRSQ